MRCAVGRARWVEPTSWARVASPTMKFAYQAGRDRKVKAFVEKANLMGELENIGESREKAILFCKYMESLVAYHKYHGGRDR